MKNLMKLTAATATAAALGIVAPAAADDHKMMSTKAEGEIKIVETNDRGKATRVMVNGITYDVCMNEQQDSCINPRAAGLNWGDRPLGYWPGKPASSKW